MRSMEEIVAAGVKSQAAIDKHLTAAYKEALKCAKITEEGVAAGMVPKAIAAKTIIADARSIPGQIAMVAAAAARLHAEQTRICQLNGVDTPAPSSVGGVEISPMGGGDR